MAVERAPYLDYIEEISYPEGTETGSDIPLFIIKSSNTVSELNADSIVRYRSYKAFAGQGGYNIDGNPDELTRLGDDFKEANKVISDFFTENSMYSSMINGDIYAPYIYVIDIGNNATQERYEKAIEISGMQKNVTLLAILGTEDINFMNALKQKVMSDTKQSLLRIAYFPISGPGELTTTFAIGKNSLGSEVVYNSTDKEYSDLFTTEEGKSVPKQGTKVYGGADETYAQYIQRCQAICEKVNSPRIAIVEKQFFGKTIAKICCTPYFEEPGYVGYKTIVPGECRNRTPEERDELFNAGIIFNEDDALLSTITPRICLATSTAWGIKNPESRLNDALIHARRNVDHHVRHIIKILAPQLKRNETSVTIRYLQTAIDEYLDNELTNGNIMEYSVNVIESEINPYALLVEGKITPVNSTLAITFSNYVGQPYAIATDYV